MNSCEERNCRFWDGKQCNDPDEWINEQGEDCCRYQKGTTVKTSSFKQLQAENKELKERIEFAIEYLPMSPNKALGFLEPALQENQK